MIPVRRISRGRHSVAVCRCLLLVIAWSWCIVTAGKATAETLIVPANELTSGFNYRMPYRGQTFMFSETVQADKLTVFVSSNIYQRFFFHLLLTEIDTADGLHPTKVLYESGPFVIPVGGRNIFIPYTADLGGIWLAGGRTYAFILDIYVALAQIDSESLWQYTTLTGMNREAGYASGDYIYLDVDCIDPQNGLPCGNREDHFAGSWVAEPAEDMGFVLSYTPVPAPPFLLPLKLLLLKGE